MKWSDVRKAYPDQWLVIEALEARTTADRQRHLDKISIVEQCSDGKAALDQCRRLHKQFPGREYYFVHTTRETLDIEEVFVPGIRGYRETRDSR